MEDKLYYHPTYTDYACTIDGRVWSNKRKGRWIKCAANVHGYLIFSTHIFGKGKSITVHKFVYECVKGELLTLSNKTSSGLTIDHIDGNKQNNSFANLQVLTLRQNVRKWSCKNYSFITGANKWRVSYRVVKKLIQDSHHKTEEEAISRVNELRQQGIIY